MRSSYARVVGACRLALAGLLLVVAGCGGGGGGGGGNQTATGVFKDANVSGLGFQSGAQSGTTDAQGRFVYEVGQPVSFMVGAVTLGSAGGQPVVTPIDLVANGSSSNRRRATAPTRGTDSGPFGVVVDAATGSTSAGASFSGAIDGTITGTLNAAAAPAT